jgi:hypothetical protein
MEIIKFLKNGVPPDYAMLNLYPDQYVSDKVKEGKDWMKINMDYFYSIALRQYSGNKTRITRNYELYKGILKREDFFEDKTIQSFTDTLLQQEDLPAYVKHYSILTPPINTLTGELTKRPDNTFVKAFDEDSKSEELQFKTDIYTKAIISKVKERVFAKAAEQGQELEEDEADKMTMEQAAEYIDSYSTEAEKWGNTVLNYMKLRFNIKEKSEDAFRDLLISARQYYHIYEDNSPLGFNMEVLNPKNVWFLSTQDEQYISDPLNAGIGTYAAGTIKIMELSEIIHKYKLPKDVIEHLRDMSQQAYLINTRESNLVNPRETGIDSVHYDTYDPLVLQYRQMIESELGDNSDELGRLFGLTSNVGVFGNKYLVVISYWCSKKKIGKLTFINEDEQPQTMLVDESYKDGEHPQQISLEWGWINQWYQGLRIGYDVYDVKPLEILDYCPILGLLYEPKNVETLMSLIDQMKPFQMLYNVCMNQLFRLLEKEIGVVYNIQIRKIPTLKDGDNQDAISMWEAEARERGIIFEDSSTENLKVPLPNTDTSRAIDLSRSNEIQSRYNLAVELRNECWKLVGLSEQRLGESKATETATGINTSLTQSYAQTEPWFSKHEYNLNKVYQALLDAALKIEATKPLSTISYITDEGESVFTQIQGPELKLKELGVFVTNRSEDAASLQQMKQFSQALIQGGAIYEASVVNSTKSIRKIQSVLKKFKENQDQQVQVAQQQKQQEMQQQQQQFQQQQQIAMVQHDKEVENENTQKELDRISKEKIAIIQASGFGKVGTEDANANGVPDIMEIQQFNLEQTKVEQDHANALRDLNMNQQELLHKQGVEQQKMALENKKLEVEKQKMVNDLKIASKKASQSSKKK